MRFSVSGIFLLLLLTGFLLFSVMHCATQRKTYTLFERTELPVFPGETDSGELLLEVLFYINADGSVDDVQLQNTSGYESWDSLALDKMKQWRFKVPEEERSGIILRKNINVQLLPSEILNLGVLIAESENDAKILHNRLRAGINFDRLVRQASENSPLIRDGYYLEEVDTIDFPADLSKILLDLEAGDYSRPVLWEGDFVIFRRYENRLP